MAYVIKFGDVYVTPDGQLTASQREALRINDDVVRAARTAGTDVRTVHLRTHDTDDTTDDGGA